MKTKLYTRFEAETLTVSCPDEDSEFNFSISDKSRKSKAHCTLSLSQAKGLAKFLNNHIKNDKLSNP